MGGLIDANSDGLSLGDGLESGTALTGGPGLNDGTIDYVPMVWGGTVLKWDTDALDWGA